MALVKPTIGQSSWGATLNTALDHLDTNALKVSTRSPFVTTNTDVTLALSDAGTFIVITADENNYSQTFKVPPNALVAFPIGTVITFITLNATFWCNELYDGDSDTRSNIYGEGHSGTNWMGFNGTGVTRLIKIATDDWILAGNNIMWD